MLTPKEMRTIRGELRGTHSNLPNVFKALCDPIRFQIFKLLMDDTYEYCVTDIAKILDISSSAVSQKIHTLEQVGLLKKEKMGKEVCLALEKTDSTVKMLKKTIHTLESGKEGVGLEK